MMNAQQMYDPQYVAARLAARRVKAEEKPMTKRYNLTDEEMAELRALIAGGADEEALGAFAQRGNMHGSSMRAIVRSIRQQLAKEAEAGPAVDKPRAVSVAAAVVTPPAAPALVGAPPAARIGTVIEWLTAIRAMRDELREHGVLVEGTVSITVDL